MCEEAQWLEERRLGQRAAVDQRFASLYAIIAGDPELGQPIGARRPVRCIIQFAIRFLALIAIIVPLVANAQEIDKPRPIVLAQMHCPLIDPNQGCCRHIHVDLFILLVGRDGCLRCASDP